MLSQKIRQQEDIEYIRDMVLRKFPLLGVTMASLKTVADDAVGTAATDGKTVYYSPKFFNPMSDEEKTFVYAHEVMHVAFNHIMRSKDRNQGLWNIATDAVINQILKSENLPMIDGGVDMAEAVNHSAEEMYEKLLKEQEDKKEQQQQQKQSSQQQNGSEGEQQPQQQSGGEGEQQPQQAEKSQQNSQEQQSDSGQGENGEQEEGQSQQNGQQSQSGDENSENQDGDNESSQAGHDNHEIWKKAIEEAEKEQQRQQQPQPKQQQAQNEQSEKPSKGLLDKLKDFFSKKEAEDKKTPEGQKEAEDKKSSPQKSSQQAGEGGESERRKGEESVYEKSFSSENHREKQRQAEQVRKMLERQKNETMKTKAEAGGHSFGPVGEAKAVLDWKKLLKKSIEEEEDRWSYRRSGADNDYMARVEELEDENKSQTEVMLDVSGSVDEEMLKEFLRQLKPILKNSELKVGCFDHRLYPFQEIKNNKDIDRFQINGGGGTNIDLAVRAFSKKKEVNKIVFTDGYSNEMPRNDLKNMNVIWLIYDNNDFHPVCGKVIYVDKRQIQQNFMQHGRFSRGGR